MWVRLTTLEGNEILVNTDAVDSVDEIKWTGGVYTRFWSRGKCVAKVLEDLDAIGAMLGRPGPVPNGTRNPLGGPVTVGVARGDQTAPYGFLVEVEMRLVPIPSTAEVLYTRGNPRDAAHSAASRALTSIISGREFNKFICGRPAYGTPENILEREAFYGKEAVSDETRCRLHTNCVKENGHHGPHQDANGEQWTNLMEGMD